MSKKNIIPIFVPHYGCPNDCVFCNQNKITGFSTDTTEEIVEDRIEEYLSYFKDKTNTEVAFYGGSFTAIEIETQSKLLNVAKKYKDMGLVKEIRLSTRPDCIDAEILNNLKKYKVDTIELGVQSLDNGVLLLSNRGHNSSCVYKSAELIKEYGFKLGLQQMLGLPGDNLEKALYTADEFIKLNPDCLRIYPTLVIKDTKLEFDYQSGEYDALSISEAVYQSKEILKKYIKNNINVIRVGLQPTEDIQLGASVVTGPFHPAFRQLVESEIIKDVILEYFENKKIKDELLIKSSGKNISNIVGQNSKQKKILMEKLNIKKLKLKQDKLDNETLEFYYNGLNETIDIKDYI